MTIMSKRGSLDNVVTYEHICDTTADMQDIDNKYITLGSTCIVISGDTGGMEIYLADSNKEWNSIGAIGGASDDIESAIEEARELIASLQDSKLDAPATAGLTGQVPRLDSNGEMEWATIGQPTDAQTAQAIADWLDDHPEATTTVEDGSITRAKLDSSLQETVDDVAELKSQIAEIEESKISLSTVLPSESVSGSVAHFMDGAALPVKQIVATIQPTQSGSGDPSPSNYREISGHTSGDIYVSPADTTEKETYTVTFPNEAGTVCAGSLIVNGDGTGTLTLTHKYIELDGVTDGKKVTLYSNGNATVPLPNGSTFGRTTAGWVTAEDALAYKLLCNSFTTGGTASPTGNYIKAYVDTNIAANARFTFASSDNVTNAATANAYFKTKYDNGNPVAFIYPLANPETYNLTVEQIKTLDGENNVWSNCGNVFVEYYCDIKNYVAKAITEQTLPVKIKVCSYNMHSFDKPTPGSVEHDNAVITAMKSFLNDQNLEIIGAQENLVTFNGLDEPVDPILFEPLFPSCHSGITGTAIKSKYAIQNVQSNVFPTSQMGAYCYGTTMINGQEILIVDVHFTSSDLSVRETQYSDLFAILGNTPYYIIFGDFNAGTQPGGIGHEQDEFDKLTEHGCHIANCGYLGRIGTSADRARALDNIATSPNIIIAKTYVPDVADDLFSDHLPIIAELFIR